MRSRRLSPEEKERRAATRQRRSGITALRGAQHSVHVRLTEEQYEAVSRIAEDAQVSIAAVIRLSIDQRRLSEA